MILITTMIDRTILVGVGFILQPGVMTEKDMREEKIVRIILNTTTIEGTENIPVTDLTRMMDQVIIIIISLTNKYNIVSIVLSTSLLYVSTL